MPVDDAWYGLDESLPLLPADPGTELLEPRHLRCRPEAKRKRSGAPRNAKQQAAYRLSMEAGLRLIKHGELCALAGEMNLTKHGKKDEVIAGIENLMDKDTRERIRGIKGDREAVQGALDAWMAARSAAPLVLAAAAQQ